MTFNCHSTIGISTEESTEEYGSSSTARISEACCRLARWGPHARGHQLAALGVPQGTVSKMLKRYQETGQFVQRRRNGQPRISTPREDRVLTRTCRANHFLSATMLRYIWMRTISRHCSIWTVRGRLLAARLRAHHPCRCSALKRRHHQTRRRRAQAHCNWQLGHWHHTAFVDESRFTLYMRDGRVRVHRCPGERHADEWVAHLTSTGQIHCKFSLITRDIVFRIIYDMVDQSARQHYHIIFEYCLAV